MPDEYAGADEQVAELRALRREQVAVCRLDAAKLGPNGSPTPGEINDGLAQTIDSMSDRLHDDLSSLDPGGGGGGGGDVGPDITEARDWLHADAWFGFGVVVALFFGYFLYRAVSPRA